MKHYKSHIVLFSFSRCFCTRHFVASRCLFLPVERASPRRLVRNRRLSPHPGVKLPWTNTEPTRKERVRNTIVIGFHLDGPKCPCAMTSSSVMGSGHSWKPGTPPEAQHQNQGAEPGFSSEPRELEFLPRRSRLPPPRS